MKYETPVLTALAPAINAIQSSPGTNKDCSCILDAMTSTFNDCVSAYADWED